jgi:hypothetical protein
MAAAVPSFERATEGAKPSDGLDFLRRSNQATDRW